MFPGANNVVGASFLGRGAVSFSKERNGVSKGIFFERGCSNCES